MKRITSSFIHLKSINLDFFAKFRVENLILKSLYVFKSLKDWNPIQDHNHYQKCAKCFQFNINRSNVSRIFPNQAKYAFEKINYSNQILEDHHG
jgi:hypothetical protein